MQAIKIKNYPCHPSYIYQTMTYLLRLNVFFPTLLHTYTYFKVEASSLNIITLLYMTIFVKLDIQTVIDQSLNKLMCLIYKQGKRRFFVEFEEHVCYFDFYTIRSIFHKFQLVHHGPWVRYSFSGFMVWLHMGIRLQQIRQRYFREAQSTN